MSDFDGNLTGLASWDPVKRASTSMLLRGGEGGPLNDREQALLNRTELLKSASSSGLLAGVVGDGATDSTAAFESASENGLTVQNGTVILNAARVSAGSVRGRSLAARLKAKAGATTVLRLGYTGTPSIWAPRRIAELTIDGSNKAADGVTLQADSNTELSGRWTLDGVALTGCKRAIYKPNGNIGNRIRDVSVSHSDFGYYSVGQSSPLMHGGCDAVHGGEINTCAKAAIYIDSPQAGTGGTTFRDLVLEGNPGFGIFVKNWADSFTPLVFDNVWHEVNATASSVEINGVTYTPKEMHLENTTLAVIKNGLVPKSIELINARVVIEDSTINDGPAMSYNIDAASVIVAERLSIDGGIHPFTVKSLVAARRQSGNQAQLHYAPPRVLRTGVSAEKLQALPYDGAGPFTFNGSISVNGTSVADGVIFGTCCEITIPNGATLVQPSVTIIAGKWCVLTLDAKLVSGTMTGFTFAAVSAVTLAASIEKLITPKWKTIASVSKCASGGAVGMYMSNATGAAVTLRLSAWQIEQFDTEQEALEFYNSGSYFK